MVNKLFGPLIHHNMEVYVDDIIVKSKKISDLSLFDMVETFQII